MPRRLKAIHRTPESPAPREPTPDTPHPNGEAAPRKPTTREARALAGGICTAADLPAAVQEWFNFRRVGFGAVTLLAGDPSAGKSTLCGALAAAATGGKGLPGGPDLLPSGVLWLGAEEDAGTVVRPRLRAAGADLRRVLFPEILASGTRRRLKFPRDAAELARIALGEGCRLWILDPITSHIGDGGAKDGGTIAREVLESLTEACVKARAAAVAIKHPRKGSFGRLIERISGNMEWVNVPRTVLYLACPREDQPGRLLITLKPYPPQRPPCLDLAIEEGAGTVRMEFRGQSTLSVKDIEKSDAPIGERDALADAKSFLADQLTAEAAPAKDLELKANAEAISRSTLRRAKEELAIESHRVGFGPGSVCYWTMPGARGLEKFDRGDAYEGPEPSESSQFGAST